MYYWLPSKQKTLKIYMEGNCRGYSFEWFIQTVPNLIPGCCFSVSDQKGSYPNYSPITTFWYKWRTQTGSICIPNWIQEMNESSPTEALLDIWHSDMQALAISQLPRQCIASFLQCWRHVLITILTWIPLEHTINY